VYPGGKEDTFTISWSAFYLDPESPKVGIPLQERMKQRFGNDEAKLAMIQAGLKRKGLQDGINFCTDSKVGNTRDAHRLIQLAKTKGNGTENKVVMELFKGYFEENGDITSFDTLTKAAVKANLDGAEVKSWLESDQGGEEVDREVDEANAKGIHGVPNFTIQGKYEVDGAQDPKDFFEVIVAAKEGKSANSFDSGFCT
jgi:predicted DsbA family dithiol-disulfide isomerase